MSFYHTDSETEIDSEVIDEAYFDSVSGTLVVVLNGGSGYEYKGVKQSDFEAFVSAPSKGRFYTYNIKQPLGPGTYLGYFNEEDSFFVPRHPQSDGVGTPKGLTYAEGAVVTGTNAPSASNYFTLTNATPSPFEAKSTTYKHTVVFTVEGGNNAKSYSVVTTGVGEAVDALTDATDALGLSINVKEVTVYFE